MVAKGALREEADNERCRVISSCEAVRASDSPSNICAVVASEDEEDEEGGKESNPILTLPRRARSLGRRDFHLRRLSAV